VKWSISNWNLFMNSHKYCQKLGCPESLARLLRSFKVGGRAAASIPPCCLSASQPLRFLMFFLSACVAGAFAMAQTEDSPNYRVEFPKGDAAWNVIFLKDTNKPAKSVPTAEDDEQPKLKQMEVIRKGGLRRDTLVWTDGAKSEHWWSIAANYVFFENRGDSFVRGMKGSQRGDARYDESFFTWIGKTTYVGNRKLNGKELWYFESKASRTLGDGETESETCSAWVDPETAKPVAWSDGRRTAFFEFKSLDPDFRLVVPPRLAEAIAKYDAYRSAPTRVKRR